MSELKFLAAKKPGVFILTFYALFFLIGLITTPLIIFGTITNWQQLDTTSRILFVFVLLIPLSLLFFGKIFIKNLKIRIQSFSGLKIDSVNLEYNAYPFYYKPLIIPLKNITVIKKIFKPSWRGSVMGIQIDYNLPSGQNTYLWISFSVFKESLDQLKQWLEENI